MAARKKTKSKQPRIRVVVTDLETGEELLSHVGAFFPLAAIGLCCTCSCSSSSTNSNNTENE
jgi:hypothetical protein